MQVRCSRRRRGRDFFDGLLDVDGKVLLRHWWAMTWFCPGAGAEQPPVGGAGAAVVSWCAPPEFSAAAVGVSRGRFSGSGEGIEPETRQRRG